MGVGGEEKKMLLTGTSPRSASFPRKGKRGTTRNSQRVQGESTRKNAGEGRDRRGEKKTAPEGLLWGNSWEKKEKDTQLKKEKGENKIPL